MFSKSKWVILALCAAFVTSTLYVETADAQRRGGSSFGGRRSSFGSSPSRSTKSKFGSSSSQSRNKSKFGTSSSKSSGNATSRKPSSSSSSKSRARDKAYSKRKYVETKKATAPPKPSYTNSKGEKVDVRTDSSTVKSIRSKPSSHYTPEKRTERYETVVHHHNYSHPYNYYSNQPYYHVGGGYSSAFWWMMAEWNAERRARWLYHNQNTIEREAYEKGMKDAAVAAEIAKLKSQNEAVNPDYVDTDFKDNPDLMYSQDYVEAAYNPKVAPQSSGFLKAFLWIMAIVIVIVAVWFFVFQVKVTD